MDLIMKSNVITAESRNENCSLKTQCYSSFSNKYTGSSLAYKNHQTHSNNRTKYYTQNNQ